MAFREWSFPCGTCGAEIHTCTGNGDVACERCDTLHNSAGQRLRERFVWTEDEGMVDTWTG